MTIVDTNKMTELIDRQRRFFTEVMAFRPIADDVRLRDTALGAIPTLEVTIEGTRPSGVMLWIHGGAFVAGSPRNTLAPAANVARAARTRVLSIDYRLAPEHPHPAPLDDALAAYRALLDEVPIDEITVGGESAGGTLALGLLVAARDAGLPLPRAAVVFSPASDLTMAGESYRTKATVDPVVTAEALQAAFHAYLGGTNAGRPLVSPLFADLAGLPPTLVQAGSHEVLLDDATRLASRLAAADVAVTLEVTPGMSHVFQAKGSEVPEAAWALENVGRFLRQSLDNRGSA
ncbi:alpha/beta hydrolase [Nocardia miyunensis]|uniref:alpha/beta hydrolase n=1 Tax=Nocardia miyunensis TaxID=282684 RepID=UPI00082ABD86|nr:alpha/beta hydrolase [Nocardia miyunensis]